MNFEECQRLCVEQYLATGQSRKADLCGNHPAPTAEEWADCIHEVADNGGDLANPFYSMESYELRLATRGNETVMFGPGNKRMVGMREKLLGWGLDQYFVDTMLRYYCCTRRNQLTD